MIGHDYYRLEEAEQDNHRRKDAVRYAGEIHIREHQSHYIQGRAQQRQANQGGLELALLHPVSHHIPSPCASYAILAF
jgi:hypothetical protein